MLGSMVASRSFEAVVWLSSMCYFGMLAAGDDHDTILQGYPWLEPEDILPCLVYARRLVVGYRSRASV